MVIAEIEMGWGGMSYRMTKSKWFYVHKCKNALALKELESGYITWCY